MNSNLRVDKLVLISACSILLASCGGQSHWSSIYAAGQQAVARHDLNEAERKYREAIADGEKHLVPEKEYAAVIADLGRVLLLEKRDDQVVLPLARALQLGSATQMPLEENIELLHKLARAEARCEDWEEATGTEKVLITLLEVEKSPLTPELVEERKFAAGLNIELAQYRRQHPQVSEDDVQKTQ